MTEHMTLEEYHEMNRTGKMPRRFNTKTRSALLDHIAQEAPDLLDEASGVNRKQDTGTKAKSELEQYLVYGGFGRMETEYRFHPVRRWRADYALLDQDPQVLIEYDGMMKSGANASHASIGGILRDSEKANAATALGFRCFRANAKSIHDGSFFVLMDVVLQVVS